MSSDSSAIVAQSILTAATASPRSPSYMLAPRTSGSSTPRASSEKPLVELQVETMSTGCTRVFLYSWYATLVIALVLQCFVGLQWQAREFCSATVEPLNSLADWNSTSCGSLEHYWMPDGWDQLPNILRPADPPLLETASLPKTTLTWLLRVLFKWNSNSGSENRKSSGEYFYHTFSLPRHEQHLGALSYVAANHGSFYRLAVEELEEEEAHAEEADIASATIVSPGPTMKPYKKVYLMRWSVSTKFSETLQGKLNRFARVALSLASPMNGMTPRSAKFKTYKVLVALDAESFDPGEDDSSALSDYSSSGGYVERLDGLYDDSESNHTARVHFTFNTTVLCYRDAPRCATVVLPPSVAVVTNESRLTVTLLGVDPELALAHYAPTAVGIVYQRASYTVATMVWRYGALLYCLGSLSRFLYNVRLYRMVYEQYWVVVLQLAAIAYLNPLFAAGIFAKRGVTALLFLEFHVPYFLAAVVVCFTFAIIAASFPWASPNGTLVDQQQQQQQQQSRQEGRNASPSSSSALLLARAAATPSRGTASGAVNTISDDSIMDKVSAHRHFPPVWVNVVLVVFLIAVVSLDVTRTFLERWQWGTEAVCMSTACKAVETAMSVTLIGGVAACFVSLLWLKRNLTYWPYLKTRPLQLACRIFIFTFITSCVYFPLVQLALSAVLHPDILAIVYYKPLLQLSTVIVATVFVNHMTYVYTSVRPSRQVPVRPGDPRWRAVVWSEEWFAWMREHGGSRYIFRSEAEESHFWAIQDRREKPGLWWWKQEQRRVQQRRRDQKEQLERAPSRQGKEEEGSQTYQLLGGTSADAKRTKEGEAWWALGPVSPLHPHGPPPRKENEEKTGSAPRTSHSARCATAGKDRAKAGADRSRATVDQDGSSSAKRVAARSCPPTPRHYRGTPDVRGGGRASHAHDSFSLAGHPYLRQGACHSSGRRHHFGSLYSARRGGGGAPSAPNSVMPSSNSSAANSTCGSKSDEDNESYAEVLFGDNCGITPHNRRRGSEGGMLNGTTALMNLIDDTITGRRIRQFVARHRGSSTVRRWHRSRNRECFAEAAAAAAGAQSRQSRRRHPFFNLETAIDCFNMAWEAYGVTESRGDEIINTGVAVNAWAAPEAVMKTVRSLLCCLRLCEDRLRHTVAVVVVEEEEGERNPTPSDSASAATPHCPHDGTTGHVLFHEAVAHDGEEKEPCRRFATRLLDNHGPTDTTPIAMATTGMRAHSPQRATRLSYSLASSPDISGSGGGEKAKSPRNNSSTTALPATASIAAESVAMPPLSVPPGDLAAPLHTEQYGYRRLAVFEGGDVQVVITRRYDDCSVVSSDHAPRGGATSSEVSSPPQYPRIVVAFRGTDNMSNAIQDIRFQQRTWREMETGALSARATVHSGFLEIWMLLKQRVLAAVLAELRGLYQRPHEEEGKQATATSSATTAAAPSATAGRSFHVSGGLQPWSLRYSHHSEFLTIHVTGHSLGGALAVLCAYTLRRALLLLQYPNPDIVVFTFGQPPVGNAAFKRLYNRAVPHTFRVVNESDAVPGLRLFGGQHVGVEVDIERNGTFVCEPMYIEKMFRPTQGQGFAVANHSMGAYALSLNAIATQADGVAASTSSSMDSSWCPVRCLRPRVVSAEFCNGCEDDEPT